MEVLHGRSMFVLASLAGPAALQEPELAGALGVYHETVLAESEPGEELVRDLVLDPDGQHALFVARHGSPAPDWLVAKVSLTDGALAWSSIVNGPIGAGIDLPQAVAVGGARVFTSGRVSDPADTYLQGIYVQASAHDQASGALLWQAAMPSFPQPSPQNAEAVEVAASADGTRAFVGYNLAVSTAGFPQYDVFVEARDGATGAGLWTWSYDGSGGGYDYLVELAVAPDGLRVHGVAHAFRAPSSTYYGPDDRDIVVFALDAATGAELWLKTWNPGVDDRPAGLAFAPDGSRVYVGGTVSLTFVPNALALGAWDAATGTPLWRETYPVSGSGALEASDVVLGPGGASLLLAGARIVNFDEIHVLAASSADGSELWERDFGPTSNRNWSAVEAALSDDGQVLAISGRSSGLYQDEQILRLGIDVAGGLALWIQEGPPAASLANSWQPQVVTAPGGVLSADSLPQPGPNPSARIEILDAHTGASSLSAVVQVAAARDERLGAALLLSDALVLAGASAFGPSKLLYPQNEEDTVLSVRELADGSERWTVHQPAPSLVSGFLPYAYGLAADPASQRLFSATSAGFQVQIAALDLADGSQDWQTAFSSSQYTGTSVHALALAPSAARVYLAMNTGPTAVPRFTALEAGSGVVVWDAVDPLPYIGPCCQYAAALAPTPDGARVVFLGQNAVGALDAASGALAWGQLIGWASGSGNAWDLALSQDGALALVAGGGSGLGAASDAELRAYAVADGSLAWERVIDSETAELVTHAALAPSGATLFAAGWTEVAAGTDQLAVHAIDVASGAIAWTARFVGDGAAGDVAMHATSVTSSADGRRVLAACDWGLAVLDSHSGALVASVARDGLDPSGIYGRGPFALAIAGVEALADTIGTSPTSARDLGALVLAAGAGLEADATVALGGTLAVLNRGLVGASFQTWLSLPVAPIALLPLGILEIGPAALANLIALTPYPAPDGEHAASFAVPSDPSLAGALIGLQSVAIPGAAPLDLVLSNGVAVAIQ